MTFARSLTLGLAAATLGATMLIAESHGADPSPAIKARQGQMQLYAFNLGTLGAMAKGEMPYDADKASAAAANLAALTQLDGSMMWPQGSDSASVEGTRALPDIWANFPDVGAKSEALKTAASAMAAAAGTDLASLQAAIGPLGQACGSCHKAYRQPE